MVRLPAALRQAVPSRKDSFVDLRRLRFSIAQLVAFTVGVAVFCFVLVNDNEWLRAAFVTAALCAAFHAVIAAIFTRGERQIFAIGFVLGTLFAGASAPAAGVTLPYVITVKLAEWIKQTMTSPPSDEHFLIVMGVFWALLAATSSAFVSLAWHRVYQAKLEQSKDGSQQVA